MPEPSPPERDAAARRRLLPRRRLTWWRSALYRLGAPVALGIVYLWWWLVPRGRVLGRERLEAALAEHRAVIPVFWHGQQMMPLKELVWYRPRALKLGLLISPSVDGEGPAIMARLAGIAVVRGSASRTGAQALRALYRAIVRDDLSPIVTPDGSHGPRRVFKAGALLLSQMSGRPIVPISYAARRVWRFRTWDRFVLPWPLTRVVTVIGEPRVVPRGLGDAALERARSDLGDELDRLHERARAALQD